MRTASTPAAAAARAVMREMPTIEQAARLLNGELDAGLLRPPLAGEAGSALQLLTLGTEPLVAPSWA